MARHAKKNRTVSTSAKVAAAGIALGAGAAILAPTAGAAPYSDWDRLAECESGGNWSINTGNGFHGGLQFHPQTWTGHGGGEFAPTADQASREQQIWVAEKVLASQGWGAWPACSAKLGLSSGVTERPKPGTAEAATFSEAGDNSAAGTETLDIQGLLSGADLDSVSALLDATSIEDLDGTFQSIADAAKSAGLPVPAEATDLYNQLRAQF